MAGVGVDSPPMRRAHSDSTGPRSEGVTVAAHRACSRSCASRSAPTARTASADPAFAASSAAMAAPDPRRAATLLQRLTSAMCKNKCHVPDSGVSRNQFATIPASSCGTMCATLSRPSRGCCALAQTNRCRTCNKQCISMRVLRSRAWLDGEFHPGRQTQYIATQQERS